MSQATLIADRMPPVSPVIRPIRPRQRTVRIRLFVADDHTLFRQTLRTALEMDGGFEIVGEASDGREALSAIESLKPEVALVDLGLPLLNGLEIARRLRKGGADTKVVVLASRSQEPMLLRMLYSGAAGCLLKEADFEELTLALRKVHAGFSYLTPRLETRPLDQQLRRWNERDLGDRPDLLTDRERELLQLVAEGYTNREIADQLCLSVKTVEAHKFNICSKLNVRGVAGLVRHALCAGMFAV